MQAIRLLASPNAFVLYFAALIVVGGFVVAWPLLEEGLRPFFGVFMSFVPIGVELLYLHVPAVRIAVYRIYYRFAGPTGSIQLVATIPLNADAEAGATLDSMAGLVRRWNKNAYVEARLDTRIVLAADARSVTATFHPPHHQELVVDDHAGDGEDDAPSTLPSLQLVVRGYETKVSKLDDRLRDEIQTLLGAVMTNMAASHALPNLTLNVRLNGTNPFLGFYLRGLPVNELAAFQVRLDEERHGVAVNVFVNLEQLSVQSTDYLALVEAARQHLLASPSLTAN